MLTSWITLPSLFLYIPRLGTGFEFSMDLFPSDFALNFANGTQLTAISTLHHLKKFPIANSKPMPNCGIGMKKDRRKKVFEQAV